MAKGAGYEQLYFSQSPCDDVWTLLELEELGILGEHDVVHEMTQH